MFKCLILNKMQNVSWDIIRPTRFIIIDRWYYFVILFFICSSYYERVIVFVDKIFLRNLFENLLFDWTVSAIDVKKLWNVFAIDYLLSIWFWVLLLWKGFAWKFIKNMNMFVSTWYL